MELHGKQMEIKGRKNWDGEENIKNKCKTKGVKVSSTLWQSDTKLTVNKFNM